MQTITNFGPLAFWIFAFHTDAFGAIANWDAHVLFSAPHGTGLFYVETSKTVEPLAFDTGCFHCEEKGGVAFNEDMP